MSLPAFDTYKAVKKLTGAGASEPLAEAVVGTVGAAMSEHMATKADLKELGQTLGQEITEVKYGLQIQTRNIVIWLGSIMMVAVGALFMLLRAFPPVS